MGGGGGGGNFAGDFRLRHSSCAAAAAAAAALLLSSSSSVASNSASNSSIHASPRTIQRADEHIRRVGSLGLPRTPEEAAVDAARASLAQAHAAALRVALGRCLRVDDLACLNRALGRWQTATAAVALDAAKKEAAWAEAVRAEAVVTEAARATARRAAEHITALAEEASAAVARADAAEQMRLRAEAEHAQSHSELLSAYDRMSARLSAASAGYAELQAAASERAKGDAAQLAAARLAARVAALRGTLASADERRGESALRRALMLWSWGVSAHSARSAWHVALCQPRLLLLRRLVQGRYEGGMRFALRRWHGTLVVSAVDRALREAEASRLDAIAHKHALGASMLLSSVRRSEAAAASRALASWLRACHTSERSRAAAAEASLRALRPQLEKAAHAQREALDAASREAAAARDECAEREGALRAALSESEHARQLAAERSAAELAAAREEADEVCKAAARESARLRHAASEVHSRQERDQKSLTHWCGAHLLQACLRGRAHIAAKAALDLWVSACEAAPPDDLWRSVTGGSASASRPGSALGAAM